MMLAMMTSVCVAAMMVGQPAEERPAQIMVDFYLIQVDLSQADAFPERDESDEQTSIELGSNGMVSVRGDGLRFTSMQSKIFVIADDAAISVRGWRYSLNGPNEGVDESPFRVVSSPRILALDTMPASVQVGQVVEYLEPADADGTFRVVQSELREGVSFGVNPRLREDGSVLLDPIEFELREIASREPVEGLSLRDVGKPVMHTTARSASVIVAADEIVVIPIVHSDFQNQPLLLLVKARHWPDGKPNQARRVPDDAEETNADPESPE